MGSLFHFETGFDKLGAQSITITRPVILRVRVGRVGERAALWEAVLPALSGKIPAETAFVRFYGYLESVRCRRPHYR